MPTTPLILDADAVARRLPGEAAVQAALRSAFAELARGTAQQPAQTLMPLADGAGDVIVYPALVDAPQLAGVKVSPYLAERPAGERVSAWTLLVSLADGSPVLLCDGMALTVERTAGTTAVAVDALAPAGARRLAVVGAGAVALAHLRHVARLRDVGAASRSARPRSRPATRTGSRRSTRSRSPSRSPPTSRPPSPARTWCACAPPPPRRSSRSRTAIPTPW